LSNEEENQPSEAYVNQDIQSANDDIPRNKKSNNKSINNYSHEFHEDSLDSEK
jgi:hypothetical protein